MSQMEKTYTIVPNKDELFKLENIQLKDGFEFFFSVFFKSHETDRDNLFRKNNLALFTISENNKIVINIGNKENCEYQKYKFIPFDNFVKNIIKKYLVYSADEFTPPQVINSFDTKEGAEEEVTKLTNESIMYDEFTIFYYEEQKEVKC